VLTFAQLAHDRRRAVHNPTVVSPVIRKRITNRAIMNFFISFLIFFSIMYYVVPKRDGATKCGIPIAKWLIVMACSFLIDSLKQLLVLGLVNCVPSRFYGYQKKLSIISGMRITFQFFWFLYGNYIYYLDKNNCYA
jgi:hypothetical protein